jgi:hypothetical protein
MGLNVPRGTGVGRIEQQALYDCTASATGEVPEPPWDQVIK